MLNWGDFFFMWQVFLRYPLRYKIIEVKILYGAGNIYSTGLWLQMEALNFFLESVYGLHKLLTNWLRDLKDICPEHPMIGLFQRQLC